MATTTGNDVRSGTSASNTTKASFVRQHVLKTKFRKLLMNITCNVWQKDFAAISDSNFQQHYRSHISHKNIKEKRNYTCEQWKKEFRNNKTNYDWHIQTHMNKKEEMMPEAMKKKEIEYTCMLCRKYMNTFLANIHIHLNMCKQKKKVMKCEICEKVVKENPVNFKWHREKCLAENEVSDLESDLK